MAAQQQQQSEEIVQQKGGDRTFQHQRGPNGEILYCTQGGSSGPKLDFDQPWYQNAQKIGFSNASKYSFRFFATEAHFNQVKVQTSKDETSAHITASFQGADFSGTLELKWNPEEKIWKGQGSYKHIGGQMPQIGGAEGNVLLVPVTIGEEGFADDGTATTKWKIAEGNVQEAKIVLI